MTYKVIITCGDMEEEYTVKANNEEEAKEIAKKLFLNQHLAVWVKK